VAAPVAVACEFQIIRMQEVTVRNRLWITCAAVLCLLFARAIPASAQNTTSADEYDLSAAAIYDPVLNERSAASNVGLHLDVAKRFLEGAKMSAAGVGELGFNHFEDVTFASYMAGIRFAGSYSQQFAPFAQLLLGSEHCCGATHFAIQPGVGVDFAWRRQMALRVQVDWRHVTQEFDDADGLRIGFGVVFPLSR
jgi:hypothetical protein